LDIHPIVAQQQCQSRGQTDLLFAVAPLSNKLELLVLVL
jgi:hypothetical protein